MKVLLLAGTTEATEFARLAMATGASAESVPGNGIEMLASFAGRSVGGAVPDFPCPARLGGFGGFSGLAATLQEGRYDWLVDATHPFAARMPHNASMASAIAGVPLIRLLRRPWSPVAGDQWHRVADLAGAASWLASQARGAQPRRVLLTIGRYELEPFTSVHGHEFVIRAIDPPGRQRGSLARASVVTARPPFDLDYERTLLAEHRIDTIVTKNSGGRATEAKLLAAREAGIDVVMVERPPQPAGPQVETAEQALRWITA